MTVNVSKQRTFGPVVTDRLIVTKQRTFGPVVTNRLIVSKQRTFVPIIDTEWDRYKVTKAEIGAWEEPPEGLSSSKIELGAWLDSPDEASFSKAEFGVWLDYVGLRRRTHTLISLCSDALPITLSSKGVLVNRTTDLSISNGSSVPWDNETYDEGDYHNLVTNTDRLVVPVGVTRGRLVANTNLSNIRPFAQRKNNLSFLGRGVCFSESSIGNTASNGVSAIVPVNGSDYFTIRNEGSTSSTLRSSLSWAVFEPISPDIRGALVHKSTNQSIIGGSITTLTFDSEVYDSDDFHHPATNTSRITIPSGVSRVRLSGSFKTVTGAASDQSVISMYMNGASFPGAGQKDAEPLTLTTQYVGAVSAILPVSPGDYFELGAFTSGNSTIQASDETWFQVEEIPNTIKYAVVQKSANQSMIDGSWTTLTWNTELADADNMHDNVTNNSRLYVPLGCTRARVSFNITNVFVDGQHNVRATLNGVSNIPGLPANETATAGTDNNNGLGSWIDVVGGVDYFELEYFTSTSGVFVSAANTTWFCLECE